MSDTENSSTQIIAEDGTVQSMASVAKQIDNACPPLTMSETKNSSMQIIAEDGTSQTQSMASVAKQIDNTCLPSTMTMSDTENSSMQITAEDGTSQSMASVAKQIYNAQMAKKQLLRLKLPKIEQNDASIAEVPPDPESRPETRATDVKRREVMPRLDITTQRCGLGDICFKTCKSTNGRKTDSQSTSFGDDTGSSSKKSGPPWNNFKFSLELTEGSRRHSILRSRGYINVSRRRTSTRSEPPRDLYRPLGMHLPTHYSIGFMPTSASIDSECECEVEIFDIKSSLDGSGVGTRAVSLVASRNRPWGMSTLDLEEEEDRIDESKCFIVSRRSNGESSQLIFNADEFKHRKKVGRRLTTHGREILSCDPATRTDEVIWPVQMVIFRLKCFEGYSLTLKRELTKAVHYVHYDDGHVIQRQGNIPTAFYFIVSGAVVESVDSLEDTLGDIVSTPVGKLYEGATFGDLALVHNTTLNVTVTCKGETELLRLDKDDYDRLLRERHVNESRNRLKTFKWLPQFRSWTAHDIAATARESKLVVYPPKKCNTCTLPRVELLSVGPSKPELLAGPSHHRFTEETRLWTVATLMPGRFFGVGERLLNTYVVSNKSVTCLVVPKTMFLRHGHMPMLLEMRDMMEAWIPPEEDLSRLYWKAAKWERHKTSLAKEMSLHNRIPRTTKWEDIPRSIRDDYSEPINLILPAVKTKRADSEAD